MRTWTQMRYGLIFVSYLALTLSALQVPYEILAADLTLIAITGIEDPLREGVREAVKSCQGAGVSVKMCTGDNVLTARSIALQCGIFTPGGIIMEGPVFAGLSVEEKKEVVPRLQVLARSSPKDKSDLVNILKGLKETVGVTGDGTNDGPALHDADVGFSMGITGTEIAKEASDIILMDDNFASIVKAIMWGRCVNDAVRKFLQFQISVNITAVIVTFVTAVASASETSALSAVQLLWINIIMDTFAALALATDPAAPSLLERKPEKKDAPLFNVDMWKQIIGQSAYQTVVILVFHFAGNSIFGYKPDPNNQSVQITNDAKLDTLVFNAFVFAQIFNSINSRRIDNKLNVFEGILRNYYFIFITLFGECCRLRWHLLMLITFVRNRCPNHHRIRWLPCFPGAQNKRSGLGHFFSSWRRVIASGCFDSLYSKRTLRATPHQSSYTAKSDCPAHVRYG